MPELPEVEALAAFLRERAVGHAVARTDVAAFSAVKTFNPPLSALAGATVTGVSRHGKFLDLDVDGLHLDDGGGFDLTEAGTQKRLAVYLVRDVAEVPGIARLGPDALAVDATDLAAILAGQRAQIKGALTDQA